MSNRRLKIGLYGFYGCGNFGDDLMAALFAKFLTSRPVDLTVLRLSAEELNVGDFRTAETPEALVEGQDLLLLGGGASMVPYRSQDSGTSVPPPGRQIGTYRTARDRILDLAAARQIPVYALSIGGSGIPNVAEWDPSVRRLLESCTALTLRLPQDLPACQDFATSVEEFPDVVLQTSKLFPIARETVRRSGARPRIGINIYMANLRRQKALYFPLLLWCVALLRRDMDFVFVDSTSSRYADYRGLGRGIRLPNTSNVQFKDLRCDLELVTSLDLIVSSRLHLGVTGLSYGTPFLSVFGEPKSYLFLRNAGFEDRYFGHRDMTRFVKLMLSRHRLSRLLRSSEQHVATVLIPSSAGHLHKLEEIVRRHQPPAPDKS